VFSDKETIIISKDNDELTSGGQIGMASWKIDKNASLKKIQVARF